MTAATKVCESCGEEIAGRAIKCHHCKSFVDGVDRSARNESGRLVAYAEGQPCPSCGEEISSQATKCRHCKEWTRASEPPRRGRRWGAMVGTLLLIACGALAVLGGKHGIPYIKATFLDTKAWEYQDQDTPSGNRTAARYYGQAAEQWALVGEHEEQAISLDSQGYCLWAGEQESWAEAAEVYERAAEAYGRAGNAAGRANSIDQQAWCLEEAGRSAEAIACYRQAAAAYELVSNPSGSASALQSVANLLEPEEGDAAAWSRSVAAREQALQAFRRAGDQAGEAYALYRLGIAATSGGAPGARQKAAKLFASSAQIERQRGSLAGEAGALIQQGHCVCLHDEELAGDAKTGSCTQSAVLYGRAADLFVVAEEPGEAARARIWQADCLAGAAGKLTTEARAAYLAAQKLAREAEDEDLVDEAMEGLRRW